MTILYFTATGNSLSVAKAVGGTLKSIPQLVENKELMVLSCLKMPIVFKMKAECKDRFDFSSERV